MRLYDLVSNTDFFIFFSLPFEKVKPLCGSVFFFGSSLIGEVINLFIREPLAISFQLVHLALLTIKE